MTARVLLSVTRVSLKKSSHGLLVLFPAAGLGERIPPEVQGGGGGGAGEAGQKAGAGVADPRDSAHRLSSVLLGGAADGAAAIIICIFLCVSHSASFCKAHCISGFIKDCSVKHFFTTLFWSMDLLTYSTK